MDWKILQEMSSAIFTLVGLPAVLVALIYIGRKLQTLDHIQKIIIEKLEPELQGVKERFIVVEDRTETMWKDRLATAHSPRQLNERGTKILSESGIKDIVDQKRAWLTQQVKAKHPANAYDAEQSIEDVMKALPQSCPDLIPSLKDGAFRAGADIDAVLYVGSLYLRNKIFEELGYILKE